MQIDASIIVAAVAGVISLGTAALAFRGGLPAAADDMATGFAKLNAELRLELERTKTQHIKEMADMRLEIEKLKGDLEVERVTTSYLRQEVNRSDQRATYYRNGSFALWNQINEINGRNVTKYEVEPVFDPRVNKFPPLKPFRSPRIDDEPGPDEDTE